MKNLLDKENAMNGCAKWGIIMNESLLHFLQHKANVAPEGYNWIASLHANTWYYCVNNTKVDFHAVRHYKLAGLHEGDAGQWFKLEDLK